MRIALSEELRLLEYSQRLRDRGRAMLATEERSTGRVLYESAVRGRGAGRRAAARARSGWGTGPTCWRWTWERRIWRGGRGDAILDAWIFAGDDRMVAEVWSAGRHIVSGGAHVRQGAITHRYRRVMARPAGRAVMTGWEAIRAEVLRRIRARDWAPGAVIPGEEALAAEFGCARATVNRALRDLAEAGVLERRRKAGTRVALNPVRRATLEIPVIRQEIEGRGLRYAYSPDRGRTEVAPVAVASAMGLPPGARMRRLVALHFADRRPFLYEQRWLNPAVLGGAAPDFAVVSANEWLVANIPYSSGDITFSAAGASEEEAVVFGVPEGAALFIVERTTWTAEAPITSVRLAHAPGYRLHTMV